MDRFLGSLAQYINREWLHSCDGLPGNIYVMAAFQGSLGRATQQDEPEGKYFGYSAGFMCILLVQLLGPPCLFVQLLFSWADSGGEFDIQWEKLFDVWDAPFYDWYHKGGKHAQTKL